MVSKISEIARDRIAMKFKYLVVFEIGGETFEQETAFGTKHHLSEDVAERAIIDHDATIQSMMENNGMPLTSLFSVYRHTCGGLDHVTSGGFTLALSVIVCGMSSSSKQFQPKSNSEQV